LKLYRVEQFLMEVGTEFHIAGMHPMSLSLSKTVIIVLYMVVNPVRSS